MKMARWPSALALTASLVAGWWYANALADPVFRRPEVALADWPAGARPVTVALVSDIHLGNAAMDAARLARVVAEVRAVFRPSCTTVIALRRPLRGGTISTWRGIARRL